MKKRKKKTNCKNEHKNLHTCLTKIKLNVHVERYCIIKYVLSPIIILISLITPFNFRINV